MKWFVEKGMKVLDVRCTYEDYVLKVQEEDGTIAFYAVGNNCKEEKFGG